MVGDGERVEMVGGAEVLVMNDGGEEVSSTSVGVITGGGEEVPSISVRRSSMVAGDGEKRLSMFGADDDCLELMMTAGDSQSADESSVSSLEFVLDDEEDDCDVGVQIRFFLNKKGYFGAIRLD